VKSIFTQKIQTKKGSNTLAIFAAYHSNQITWMNYDLESDKKDKTIPKV